MTPSMTNAQNNHKTDFYNATFHSPELRGEPLEVEGHGEDLGLGLTNHIFDSPFSAICIVSIILLFQTI